MSALPEMTTVWIPESNWKSFTKEIKRLNRKAEKHGSDWMLPELTGNTKTAYVVRRATHRTDEFFYTEVSEKKYHAHFGLKLQVPLVEVTIHGQPLTVEGWEFIALIDHGEAANVLLHAPNSKVPKSYRNSDPYCDHCKTNRMRKRTVLLRKGRQYRQIGKTCLRDYFPNSAEQVAAAYDIYAKLWKMGRPDWGHLGPKLFDNFINTEHYLVWVSSIIRRYGWVSRKEAAFGDDMDTASRALDCYYNGSKHQQVTVDKADEELAKKVLKWATEEIPKMTRYNDYLNNVHAACARAAIEPRMVGIIASAVSAYQREMDRDKAKKQQAKQQAKQWAMEPFGNIGDRVELEVEVVTKRFFEGSDYRTGAPVEKCAVTMRDTDKHKLVWMTEAYRCSDMNEGDKLRIRGTVKRHSEFRGVPETKINRVKVEA